MLKTKATPRLKASLEEKADLKPNTTNPEPPIDEKAIGAPIGGPYQFTAANAIQRLKKTKR